MHLRAVISFFLVASIADLNVIPCAPAATNRRAKGRVEDFRQQAEWYGVGADVRIYLHGSEKIRGRIESMGDQSVGIQPAGGAILQRISYEQIHHIEYAKTSYRAGGQPDPLEVRRVALGLGSGHAVTVRTDNGKALRGRIVAVEAEKLTLRVHGRSKDLVYPQIRQLKGRMTGTEIGLLVGVGVIGLGLVLGYTVGARY